MIACDVLTQSCVSEEISDTAATSATVSSLTSGRNYTVAVEVWNAIGSSGNATAAGEHSTLGVPVQAYPPFEAEALDGLDGKTTLHVMWHAPWANGLPITQFDLELDGNPKLVAVNSSGTPQYVFSSMIPGTSHDVRVRAVNSQGSGAWSAALALNLSLIHISEPTRPY